jgi:hypothetical protein
LSNKEFQIICSFCNKDCLKLSEHTWSVPE